MARHARRPVIMVYSDIFSLRTNTDNRFLSELLGPFAQYDFDAFTVEDYFYLIPASFRFSGASVELPGKKRRYTTCRRSNDASTATPAASNATWRGTETKETE